MTNKEILPDINKVINDLAARVASLTRENAIMKATLEAYEEAFKNAPAGADGGEL